MQWVQAINQLTKGQVIAVDGKTLRRSHDRSNAKAAIHMISAWAKETSLKKKSIKSKRLRAGWDNDYLLKVING